MANKKMAAQSSGSLQTCDWVGGEGGKFVAPGYNASTVEQCLRSL